MPRNDDGQFEMVLGNKQVLSILFIVVILLGVFFTMGYMLGRSSLAPATPVSASAKSPATMPSRAAPDTSRSVSPFESAPQKAPPARFEEALPPAASESPAAEASPRTEFAALPVEPAEGQTFLQVVAVKRQEAELVAGVLSRKGFRSVIAPHPTEDLFRVLVGPLEGAGDIAKTRAGLEAAGFKPFVRKY